jgi:hypothetical protein
VRILNSSEVQSPEARIATVFLMLFDLFCLFNLLFLGSFIVSNGFRISHPKWVTRKMGPFALSTQSSKKFPETLPEGVLYKKDVAGSAYQMGIEDKWMHKFWKLFMQNSLELQLLPANGNPLHDDYKYLGGNNDSSIVMKRLSMSIPGKFIAVIDNAQPNRAFIGHTFEIGEYTLTGTFGGIVYFEENGRQRGYIKTFPCCLFENDFRNGLPWTEDITSQNIFLHRNSLVFTWSVRNGNRNVRLQIAQFKEDQLVSRCEFQTGINLKRRYYQLPELIFHDRWICLQHEEDQNITCYDVTSFRTISETKKLFYDSVTVSNTSTAPLVEVLTALTQFSPSYDSIDRGGYPKRCIKCGGRDSIRSILSGYVIHWTWSLGLFKVYDPLFSLTSEMGMLQAIQGNQVPL